MSAGHCVHPVRCKGSSNGHCRGSYYKERRWGRDNAGEVLTTKNWDHAEGSRGDTSVRWVLRKQLLFDWQDHSSLDAMLLTVGIRPVLRSGYTSGGFQ